MSAELSDTSDEATGITGSAPAAWGEPRSKTVTWYDPRQYRTPAQEMSGLELLQAMAAGELPPPPIMFLLGGGALEMTAEPQHVSIRTTPDESVYNPIGMVHGGYITTLLDTVAACAIHTTLPAGVPYTSVEIKVNFLRAVQGGMDLTAHGWVTKPGRKVAFAEADLRDAAGVVYATASTTCVILG